MITHISIGELTKKRVCVLCVVCVWAEAGSLGVVAMCAENCW